jgi:nascent polypeptide-associated complex subunit alpha
MFGGINPNQLKGMMKQMGIKQEEVETSRVIIEKTDGNRIVIEPANVQKITMQGQESWQVTGEAREEAGEVSDSDVKLIMEKTGKSEAQVRSVLEEVDGDMAEAIVMLSE